MNNFMLAAGAILIGIAGCALIFGIAYLVTLAIVLLFIALPLTFILDPTTMDMVWPYIWWAPLPIAGLKIIFSKG